MTLKMQQNIIIKLALIAGLIIGLMLPLIMINELVNERSQYRYQAQSEIADTWSGAQTLIGPILAQPYQLRRTEQIWDDRDKSYHSQVIDSWVTQYHIPEKLSIETISTTELRSRGIYDVPVYTTEISLDGNFDAFTLNQHRQEAGEVSALGKPFLVMSVSDLRGLGSSPNIQWDDEKLSFKPGTKMISLLSGMHVDLPDIIDPEKLNADFNMRFTLRGSQAMQMVAIGNETVANMQSNWSHPRFFGRFLPISRDINNDGFSAQWDVSSYATNAMEKLLRCADNDCYDLMNSAFGVDFVQPVDIYTQSERAIKYGVLFITLSFAAFFLFEIMANIRLHIVQYALVGSALAMFYLLLLSLSEHMPFLWAYLIANINCSILIGVYLSTVLQSQAKGWGYSISIHVLYWMLYSILRSEDFALLMGCVLLFSALAIIMLLTRKLDWFQLGKQLSPTRK